MNKKIIAILFLAIATTGCMKGLRKTEYVEVLVPVAVVPAPPKVVKPVWETSKLTPEQRLHIGIVSHALVTESKQKDGYIEILEEIINRYEEESKNNKVPVPPFKL